MDAVKIGCHILLYPDLCLLCLHPRAEEEFDWIHNRVGNIVIVKDGQSLNLKELRNDAISAALACAGGNITTASKLLGVARSSVYYYSRNVSLISKAEEQNVVVKS